MRSGWSLGCICGRQAELSIKDRQAGPSPDRPEGSVVGCRRPVKPWLPHRQVIARSGTGGLADARGGDEVRANRLERERSVLAKRGRDVLNRPGFPADVSSYPGMLHEC